MHAAQSQAGSGVFLPGARALVQLRRPDRVARSPLAVLEGGSQPYAVLGEPAFARLLEEVCRPRQVAAYSVSGLMEEAQLGACLTEVPPACPREEVCGPLRILVQPTAVPIRPAKLEAPFPPLFVARLLKEGDCAGLVPEDPAAVEKPEADPLAGARVTFGAGGAKLSRSFGFAE